MAEEFGGFPLSVGSIRGYREWYTDGLGRLFGLSYHDIWKPGENIKVCRAERENCRFDECTCGFYAYYQKGAPFLRVGGVVEGYGETTIYTKGFRCSKARILGLYFPDQRENEEFRKAYAAASSPTTINGTWGTTSSATTTWQGFGLDDVSVPALDDSMCSLVQRNYGPEVEYFNNWAELLKRFPADSPEKVLPSPDSDPDFWTRPLVTG